MTTGVASLTKLNIALAVGVIRSRADEEGPPTITVDHTWQLASRSNACEVLFPLLRDKDYDSGSAIMSYTDRRTPVRLTDWKPVSHIHSH
jgi:hypothetical protein